MEGKFVVIAIDGNAADLVEPYTNSLRYDGLNWQESADLCRLSFMQGYQCVLWKIDEEKEV